MRPKPLLLVTATAHLDSQWRWTIRDTIRDFLPRTLEENFALFRSHPGYVLSFEGAFRYMLVREYYPEAWQELVRWCANGRWAPAGGMLDAPDVNIVAPESLIRHVLYGNGFFTRELGVASRDLFLPDCFGFGHALPSIAAHCGLEVFSSSKLLKWKAPGEIPFDLGRWRGPDGAEILAVLRPGGYGEGIEEDLSHSSEWIERLEATRARCGVAVGMRYVGTGDRGGSPDRASLDHLERSLAADGPIEVRCRPSDAILDHLDGAARDRLPVHDGEILLPTHGTGCWTSQAALKRWNRKNEGLAGAAERAAVAAELATGLVYPGERLEEAWRRFLWHQMHDDLTGTSIPAAYDITWNDEAVAANLFAGVLTDSVAAIARRLDTRGRGLPLLVFNPSGFERSDVVEALVDGDRLPAGELEAVGPEGGPTPVQRQPCGEGRVRLLFVAATPPLSFTVFDVARAEPTQLARPQEIRADERGLENGRYRIAVDDAGDVVSIFDKTLDCELLRAPLTLELLRDDSMRWPAWEIRPETILQPRAETVHGSAVVTVEETGPVRASLRIERHFKGSTLVERLRLARDGAGRYLEIDCELDWRTRGRLLKARFPLSCENREATYDLGLGAIRRDNNSAERYEVPAQQWADLTDVDGRFGVAILNDSLYGWDKPDDATLRLSLARSPRSLRKYPHQRRQDLGRHRFTLALAAHAGDGWRAEVARLGERLAQPLRVFSTRPSPGDVGRTLAVATIESEAAGLMALKKAERGDLHVIRLRDLGGEGASGSIRFPTPPRAAIRLSGDERPIEPLPTGEQLDIAIAPSSLETIGVELEPLADAPPTFHRELELPFDRRTASRHGAGGAGDLDGYGHSLPAERFPADLKLGEVPFRLGPADGPNALGCDGQEIFLGEGWERLWLIAAAIRGPLELDLELGVDAHRIRVADWSAPLAERARPRRWAGLIRGREERLTTDSLAWLGTHRHRTRDDGTVEDEVYTFCYLFRYAVDLPPEARRLRLGRQPRVLLFAATLTRADVAVEPMTPLYGT